MKKILMIICIGSLAACKPPAHPSAAESNEGLAKLFDNYYEGALQLDPLNATYIGDPRYNDRLALYGAADYLKAQHDFYTAYLDSIKTYKRDELNEEDKLSYDIFVYEAQTALDGLKYHYEYLPFNQMFALPLTIGQLGSGAGAQPFKTAKDYSDWLKRLGRFSVWADTAIANFNKGIKSGIVFPRALVVKMIPQMESFVVTDPEKSLFMNR